MNYFDSIQPEIINVFRRIKIELIPLNLHKVQAKMWADPSALFLKNDVALVSRLIANLVLHPKSDQSFQSL